MNDQARGYEPSAGDRYGFVGVALIAVGAASWYRREQLSVEGITIIVAETRLGIPDWAIHQPRQRSRTWVGWPIYR